MRKNKHTDARLRYLLAEIEAERISYGDLIELQALAPYIVAHHSDNIRLLEWAGVPEFEE